MKQKLLKRQCIKASLLLSLIDINTVDIIVAKAQVMMAVGIDGVCLGVAPPSISEKGLLFVMFILFKRKCSNLSLIVYGIRFERSGRLGIPAKQFYQSFQCMVKTARDKLCLK